jgi:broad specificity phosphatase PhoE
VILLARHGQTDDNVPPLRFMGRRDSPLNAIGRAQAHELAERVRAAGARSLYTSDLIRARVTAEIVGEAVDLEPVEDARLAESWRGEWEGRRWPEVQAEDPEGWAAWMAAGEDFRFPGGESLREQQDRVMAALRDIERSAPAPAVAVCHGGSIRVALCHTDPRGLAAFHEWEIPNVLLLPYHGAEAER